MNTKAIGYVSCLVLLQACTGMRGDPSGSLEPLSADDVTSGRQSVVLTNVASKATLSLDAAAVSTLHSASASQAQWRFSNAGNGKCTIHNPDTCGCMGGRPGRDDLREGPCDDGSGSPGAGGASGGGASDPNAATGGGAGDPNGTTGGRPGAPSAPGGRGGSGGGNGAGQPGKTPAGSDGTSPSTPAGGEATADSQQWELQSLGDGKFVIKMAGTQLCIGVKGGGTSGKPVQVSLMTCSQQDEQVWEASRGDDATAPDGSALQGRQCKPRGPGGSGQPGQPSDPNGATDPNAATPSTPGTPGTPGTPSDPNTASTGNTPAPDATGDAACPGLGAWPSAAKALEDEVLTLVNQERAKGGNCGGKTFGPAGPLKANAALRCAARGHSKDMGDKNYFDHTSQDGRSFDQRIKQAGLTKFGALAENIAAGDDTAQGVMKGWMGSPGHCENILNPDLDSLGVGFYAAPNAQFPTYWTQDFAGSR